MASRLTRAFTYLYERLVRYALKFGVVGLVGFFIDVGIFNLLYASLGPYGSKIISVLVATLVTWFGNRYWTFREHRRHNFMLELLEFGVIAGLGMGIALACLWVSHYLLGFTSQFADNIAANVVGLFIATAFRFLMYRFWVFGPQRSDGLSARRAREALSTETDIEPA